MSWDVSPKWINSLNCESPKLSNSSFIRYSTAFTSWFVTLSICFILFAESIEKSLYRFLKSLNLSEGNSLSWLKGIWHKLIKYSTSTFILYFINADSEKYFCKLLVLELYLPSIGDIAVKELNVILKFLNWVQNYKIWIRWYLLYDIIS